MLVLLIIILLLFCARYVPSITEEGKLALDTPPPPYTRTPGGILFLSFFNHHTVTGVRRTPPPLRLNTVPNSNIITPSGGYRSPATSADLDTSVEAAAAPHHSEPNEFSAPTRPVPDAAASPPAMRSFLFEISPLTGAGAGATDTPSLVSAVPQVLPAGTDTGRAREAQTATANSPGKGLKVPSAAPESSATTDGCHKRRDHAAWREPGVARQRRESSSHGTPGDERQDDLWCVCSSH